MSSDFLHMLIVAAAAAARESPSELWRLEVRLRREHGGTRHYIRQAMLEVAPRCAELPRGDAAAGQAPFGSTR